MVIVTVFHAACKITPPHHPLEYAELLIIFELLIIQVELPKPKYNITEFKALLEEKVLYFDVNELGLLIPIPGL